MRRIETKGWHGACRWAVAFCVLLANSPPLFAQTDAPPLDGIETVRSEGVRELETIISRAGWHLMGRVPEGYRVGLGTTAGMTRPVAAYLQACDSRALQGHGAIERTIAGAGYAGKRVRLVGHIKKQGDGSVRFYVNAVGAEGRLLRSFSLQNASRDTWETKDIVADMPDATTAIDIGVAVWNSSTIKLWLEAVTIEIVDNRVPTAGAVETGGFQRALDDTVVNCEGARQ